mmetsp:Transcript_25901/g.72528  ORF Transcript_25901/g.72528 Transcript_25901/m.72528 type:complete len:150 (+) Transcript_25901:3-452(+)
MYVNTAGGKRVECCSEESHSGGMGWLYTLDMVEVFATSEIADLPRIFRCGESVFFLYRLISQHAREAWAHFQSQSANTVGALQGFFAWLQSYKTLYFESLHPDAAPTTTLCRACGQHLSPYLTPTMSAPIPPSFRTFAGHEPLHSHHIQ